MRKLILATLILLIPTQVWAMGFITQEKWNRRGVKEAVYSTKDGKPYYSVKSWDGVIRKRFKGDWLGTTAITTKAITGKAYDIASGIKLHWFETDNLEPFEITKGELQHLAEWGAHISALELSAKPTKDLVFTHELEFSAGSKVGYRPLTLAPEEINIIHAVIPPAVLGSYAVYDKEYCKYAHIPRPIARDGNGKYVWGTIQLTYLKTEIRDGENVDVYASLVTFKKTDLATLTAPFTLYGLDTFGRTSVGGAGGGSDQDMISLTAYSTPAANGTTNSITVRGNCADSGKKATFGIYPDSSGSPSGQTKLVDTAEVDYPVTAADVTGNTDSAANVVAGTYYWLALNNKGGTGGAGVRYDTGISGQKWYYKASTYVAGTLPATCPTGLSNLDQYVWTIYVTYTPGGGAAGFTIKPQMISVVQS